MAANIDNVSNSSVETWWSEEAFAETDGYFFPPDEGEHPEFEEATDDNEFAKQCNFIRCNLGLSEDIPPRVLFTLWSRRTIKGTTDDGPRINFDFVEYMLIHKDQSVGATCAKWYFYHNSQRVQHNWKPNWFFYNDLKHLHNDRFVLIACLDEVFHKRESTWIARRECRICKRVGQHTTCACYWFWSADERKTHLKQHHHVCPNCLGSYCLLGDNCHRAIEGREVAPGVFVRRCYNCNLWSHREWACPQNAPNRPDMTIMKRLILTAHVTRNWSFTDLRRLLDDYCDKHMLPRFNISEDPRIGAPFTYLGRNL